MSATTHIIYEMRNRENIIPIEFLHRASDFQFSAFENGGLSADFEPHSVLIGISLLVNLVDIGFD